jgi:magnesium-transporting ATPase (P-type)
LEKNTLHRTKQIYTAGVLSGMSFFLIVICIYLYYTHFPQDAAHKQQYADQMLDLYKILIYIIFLLFLVSINIFIWIRANINFQYILKIEPKPYFGKWYTLCFSLSVFVLTMVSLTFFLLCVGYDAKGFPGFGPEWVHPIVLYGVILVWMFFPFRFFFGHIRFWILGSLWRCACAPFAKVHFQDIFMGMFLFYYF